MNCRTRVICTFSHLAHIGLAPTYREYWQQPEGGRRSCSLPALAAMGKGKKRLKPGMTTRLGAASSPLVLLLLLFASASAQGWWKPGPGVSWQVKYGLLYLDIPFAVRQ